MNHSEIDQVSLEMARQVADRLRRNPKLLKNASANLTRWKQQNASADSLLRSYAEWEDILARPVGEICDLLCAQTSEGQRLRQNSPFVGILSPAEVWEIKARFRHASAAA
jgi:Arc/MetJ family transcription regulator